MATRRIYEQAQGPPNKEDVRLVPTYFTQRDLNPKLDLDTVASVLLDTFRTLDMTITDAFGQIIRNSNNLPVLANDSYEATESLCLIRF